jgi:tetratricopeptide (TPR) repeat protein
MGKHHEAVDDYSQAIKLDPEYAKAYADRGISFSKLGDKQKAMADYNAAIRIAPDYPNAYCNRGAYYANSGDMENASQDARKACELGNCTLLRDMRRRGELIE